MSRVIILISFIVVILTLQGVVGQTPSDNPTAPEPTTSAPTDATTPTATDAPTPALTDAPTHPPTNATTPEPTDAPTNATPTAIPTAIPTPTPTPSYNMKVTLCGSSSCGSGAAVFPSAGSNICINSGHGGLEVHCQSNGEFIANVFEGQLGVCNASSLEVATLTALGNNNSAHCIDPPSHQTVCFEVQCATQITCPPLTALENQSFLYNGTKTHSIPSITFSLTSGVVNIVCDDGYSLRTANPYITCTANTWSPLPDCLLPGYCPPLAGYQRQYNMYDQSVGLVSTLPAQPAGTQVNVKCMDGWYIDTGDSQDFHNNAKPMTCNNGTWSQNYPACINPTRQCPAYVIPNHVNITDRTGRPISNIPYDDGTVLTTKCINNYASISDPRDIVCQNGTWVGQPIMNCKSNVCPTPSAPNGYFSPPLPSAITNGMTFKVICNPGYKLIVTAGDDGSITCQQHYESDAGWVQPTPLCVSQPTARPTSSSDLTGNPTDTSDTTYAKKVAGGVLGGILGFAFIIVCLYCICKRQAKYGRFTTLGHDKHTGEEMAQMTNHMDTAEEI